MESTVENKKGDVKLQSLSSNKSHHHHQIPSLNLHRKLGKPKVVEDLFDGFQALKPAESYPLPLVAANNISNKILNGIEICNTLVVEKSIFLKSKRIIQINASRAYKKNTRSCKLRIDDIDEKLKTMEKKEKRKVKRKMKAKRKAMEEEEGNVEGKGSVDVMKGKKDDESYRDKIGNEGWRTKVDETEGRKRKMEEEEEEEEELLEGDRQPLEIPRELYNLAVFLEKDPDSDFIGDENWYYSNCIVVKNILNTPCVISARGVYNNELGIIPLTLCHEDHEWRADESRMLQCRLDNLQPVLQVAATKKGFIAIRKKSTISIVKLKGLAAHSPSTTPVLTLHTSRHPFTCVDIHKREIIVANTARELRVYDVRNDVAKLEVSVPSHPDCSYSNKWNSVAYSRDNTTVAVFADACGVSAVDLSRPSSIPLNFWCTKSFLAGCERICLLRQSEVHTDLWYLATTHHLFGLRVNLRGSAAFEFRTVHHMSACPLYCAVKCVDNQETVVLGDQACNQLRSFRVHFAPSGSARVWAYATYVNSPLDTLHQARTRGELLWSSLTKRFDNNLMGLSFLPAPNESPDPTFHHAHRRLTLFSLRSSGDVFYQDVSQKFLDERFNSQREQSFENGQSAQNERLTQNELEKDLTVKNDFNTPAKRPVLKDFSVKKELNSPIAKKERTEPSARRSRSRTGSPVNRNVPSDEFSTANQQDLNVSVDMFASQMETAETWGYCNENNRLSQEINRIHENNRLFHENDRLFLEDDRLFYEEDRLFQEDNRSSHEETRSSHGKTRSLNEAELSVLQRWATQVEEADVSRVKPLVGAQTAEIPCEFFSDTSPRFQHLHTTPPDLTSLLSDLQLSGIDTNILKCKDPIFHSITTWSDDSSEDESINRNVHSDSNNRSDYESYAESVEENVDADTLKDLYVMSDSDISEASAASRSAAFARESSDPDEPDDQDNPDNRDSAVDSEMS